MQQFSPDQGSAMEEQAIVHQARSLIYCITANLLTNIVDFRGFDSSVILILRGGIPRPIGDFPGSLSQAIWVG